MALPKYKFPKGQGRFRDAMRHSNDWLCKEPFDVMGVLPLKNEKYWL